MQFENNPLEELAERVRCGDPGAAEEFRGEMSLALEGMVRLALRKVACFNPFEEYARAEADRLRESSDWQLPRHELARRTAGQVCQDMIVRLKAGGRIQDTFACLDAGRSSSRIKRSWLHVHCRLRPVFAVYTGRPSPPCARRFPPRL